MTAAGHDFIAGHAAKLAADLPASIIQDLAHALASLDAQDWTVIRLRLLSRVPQPRFHGLIDEFLAGWQARAPEVSPQSVALALLAASAAVERTRLEQTVELVWTGPDTPSIPMRRTDQALLQVIDAARRKLLVVSFAVYQIDAVVQALIEAGRRGVRLRICLEAPEPGGQRLAYDTIRALGPEVGHLAQLYIWPLDQRPLGPSGKPASLHAKCAVADGELLFISSANLTGYALALNMELGVLIKGGDLPGRVVDHFGRLIENGTLRRTQHQEQGG
jgi:phosphatidylserine/phosphatidylglycerophosphate/cardiolipin synthase-like enzyme